MKDKSHRSLLKNILKGSLTPEQAQTILQSLLPQLPVEIKVYHTIVNSGTYVDAKVHPVVVDDTPSTGSTSSCINSIIINWPEGFDLSTVGNI